MQWRDRRRAAGGAAVLALAAAALPGAASASGAQSEPPQPKRARAIVVKPDNQFGEIELDMRLEALGARAAGGRRGERTAVRFGDAVPIGERVVICFTSNEDGYVTVWSRDAEGNVPVRIYPNEYAAETADAVAAPVASGEETCLGENSGFRLEVGPPAGEAEVYLHYTRDESEQFDETAFPQIRTTLTRDPRPYVSRHLRYRVVR